MQKLIIGGIVILLLLVGGLYVKEKTPLGSVAQGNEYHSTSTSAMMGTGTAKMQRLIQTAYNTTSVTLGSVVIASSSDVYLKIWNATSTTDVASTSEIYFPKNMTAGTYTFDSIFTRGLIVEMPADYLGDAIITYR
jgi:hypothetical protein